MLRRGGMMVVAWATWLQPTVGSAVSLNLPPARLGGAVQNKRQKKRPGRENRSEKNTAFSSRKEETNKKKPTMTPHKGRRQRIKTIAECRRRLGGIGA